MATSLSIEAAPGSGVFVDLTAYLRQGSVTSKFNTLDFQLVDPPSNLLTLNQASLETDTSGWLVGGNAAIAQSSAQALDGTHSLSLTAIFAGDMDATTPTGLAGIPVAPGATYTARAAFRAFAAARLCVMYIQWWDSSGTIISNSTAALVDTSTGWTVVSVTAAAPANAAFASLLPYVSATGLAGEIHYVDAIAFAAGASQPFVPGGTGATLMSSGAQRGVKLTDPAWVGTIASVMTSDPVDRRNSHAFWTISAINAAVLPNDTAPFDLSDVPADATTFFLLEDGSGHLLLEDGTDWASNGGTGAGGTSVLETEAAKSWGYAGLSVQVRASSGAPNQTLGRCIVYHPGLRPGNQFKLTSLNQAYIAAAFQITQVTATWPGKSTSPVFAVEFGDTPQTLALWTQIHAPVPAPVVAPPVVTPPTVTTYGACSAAPDLMAMGGGVVTIASASFSVSAAQGRTLTVQIQGAIDARMDAWDNYVAAPRRSVRAVLSGGLFTGAWQELPFGLARATYDLSSASGIPLADGTYTLSIQVDNQEYNQMRVYGSWAQAAVTST